MTPDPVDPALARREARRILDGADFRGRHPPRPLRGVLSWIGDRFRPITDWVGDVGDWIVRDRMAATVVSLVVVAAAVIVGSMVVRRRSFAVAGGESGARRGGGRESAAALERRADEAERQGDHELALRLRFRAGLLRLDEVGVLTYRPSLTTGAVTRQVPSPTLAGLAATVDEVVYGGRPASGDDVEAARRGWPTVLIEARPR